MIARPSRNKPRSGRCAPLLGALLLLSTGLGGCADRVESGNPLPDPEDCQAQTDRWAPACPQLFLKDYFLHVQDVSFRLLPDQRLEFQATLLAWRDVDVNVTEISGLIGHNQVTDATIQGDWGTPLELGAGDSFGFKATSREAITPDTSEVFFGINFQYRDSMKPEFNHVLVVFNRCYGVEGDHLVPLESVESTEGTRLDCTASQYETTGEASAVAMVLHNYQGESHAFPPAQNTGFWERMRT